jgi:hypothetical protein
MSKTVPPIFGVLTNKAGEHKTACPNRTKENNLRPGVFAV